MNSRTTQLEFQLELDQLSYDGDFYVSHKGVRYEVRCYYENGDVKSFSLQKAVMCGDSMNIEKLTSTCIVLYSYDMMEQKTTYRMKFNEIELVK